jgi:hypothetical protein
MVNRGLKKGLGFEEERIDSVLQSAGSPFDNGIIVDSLRAIETISGNTWVMGSEGILKTSPSSNNTPFGVAIETVSSGAKCKVLTQGLTYLIAEDTVTAGQQIVQGTDANSIKAIGSEANARGGICMQGASSGATTLVYLI